MVLQTIVLTLVVYSAIGCIAFIATKENETVAGYFGIGIVGIFIQGIFWTIRKIKRIRRDILTRSIYKCPDGIHRRCRIKNTNYINYVEGYQLMKRYALKPEWTLLEDVPQDVIDSGYKEFKLDEEEDHR